jgi:hypothetical protein
MSEVRNVKKSFVYILNCYICKIRHTKLTKGHVTRCNFSCNLQCNSTLERC